MQNVFGKKRKIIFKATSNKNKKSEKSEISNDDEVYYELIKYEHPNELHKIVIANEYKYDKGEIGSKLFESKRLINILNMVNTRVNDDCDSLEKINNNLVAEYKYFKNTN